MHANLEVSEEGEEGSKKGQFLANNGYAVFPNVFNPGDIEWPEDRPQNWGEYDTWEKLNERLAEHTAWKAIPNGKYLGDDAGWDGSRGVLLNPAQTPKDRPVVHHITKQVIKVMQEHVNKHTFAEVDLKAKRSVVAPGTVCHTVIKLAPIRSKAGCGMQPKHCDFQWRPLARREGESKIKRMRRIPYSFVIPMHASGATLALRPYYTSEYKEVWFPRGAMILFAGDVVHGGCSYNQDNYRMHGYIKTNEAGVHQEPSLWDIPDLEMPLPDTRSMYTDWENSRGELKS